MTDETHSVTSGAAGPSRRRLLRAGAGAVAAGGLFGGVGTAGAQENDSAGNESGDEGTDTALARAAIRDSAPTLGSEDYNGLFLQIEGTDSSAEEPDASGCGFVEGEQPVATFNGHLISRIDDTDRSERVTVFANADSTELSPGRLFVVNNAQTCGGAGGLVQLRLEGIGASQIDGAVDDQSGPGEDGTNNPIPGFGPATALGGLAAAGAAALGLRGRDGDD